MAKYEVVFTNGQFRVSENGYAIALFPPDFGLEAARQRANGYLNLLNAGEQPESGGLTEAEIAKMQSDVKVALAAASPSFNWNANWLGETIGKLIAEVKRLKARQAIEQPTTATAGPYRLESPASDHCIYSGDQQVGLFHRPYRELAVVCVQRLNASAPEPASKKTSDELLDDFLTAIGLHGPGFVTADSLSLLKRFAKWLDGQSIVPFEPMKPVGVDWRGKLQTRDGRPAELVNPQPLDPPLHNGRTRIVIYATRAGDRVQVPRHEDGRCRLCNESVDDIVNVPPPVPETRNFWMNIYERSDLANDCGATIFTSRNNADRSANVDRVACIPCPVRFIPGEGLEPKP